jgi:hypothetical protein
MKTRQVKSSRLMLLSIVLNLVTTLSFADPGRPIDPDTQRVWDAILDASALNPQFVAGTTHMTMEFLDRKGRTDQILRALSTTTASDDGLEQESTILEVPGGLIGTFMPKEAMGPDGMSGASSNGDTEEQTRTMTDPFLPEVQPSLWIDSLHESALIRGEMAAAYAIRWVAPDGTEYDGRIWLSANELLPVHLEVTGDSVSDSIRDLSVSIDYQSDINTVLPVSVITSMEFRYALVVRVRVRMTLEFEGYFRVGEPSS